jgi:hypothetical protein
MSKFIFSDETETALIEDLVDSLKKRGYDAKLRRGYVRGYDRKLRREYVLMIGEELDAYDVKLILDMIDDMVNLDFVDTLSIINR